MTDTWGIPGPAFLFYYLILILALIVLATVHRRSLLGGPRGVQLDHLGPQQLGYLNGGDQLALYSALGGLRGAGAISSGPGRTLTQSGTLPPGVTPLDSAIYHAAGRGVRARDVRSDQWVADALRQLRDGLESAGLAVSAENLRMARLWALGGAALVALGVIRFVAGVANDKSVFFLIPLIFLAFVVTLALMARTRYATRAAVNAMRGLRRANKHLAPVARPAYATYGPAGAAMGVALFGAASLYAMDPAFAAEAEVQRTAATGGSSGYSESGSSSCGSSSSGSDGGGGGGGGCGGGGGGCGG